ncbi:YbaB/EbfC family DNA-binding protein [Amycolatopsis sp. NPDC098790]|uniref:YbaB/EbfC family DNA-binding protein n=1 Tax=Amycolatopsis sp. NPDC098790 TaxID=3363939 RepID=UPI00382C0837
MSNAQLIEEMRWQLKQIEDRKAENQRRLDEIAESGPVTVLTGPDGRVNEVRLAPDAMRLDAGTLSQIITAAIRKAGPAATPPSRRKPIPADEDEPYDTVYDV